MANHLCSLAILLTVTTLNVTLSMIPAQAIQCRNSSDYSDRGPGWWSWREIDGRRCWFKKIGAMPPKSEFTWAASPIATPIKPETSSIKPETVPSQVTPSVQPVQEKLPEKIPDRVANAQIQAPTQGVQPPQGVKIIPTERILPPPNPSGSSTVGSQAKPRVVYQGYVQANPEPNSGLGGASKIEVQEARTEASTGSGNGSDTRISRILFVLIGSALTVLILYKWTMRTQISPYREFMLSQGGETYHDRQTRRYYERKHQQQANQRNIARLLSQRVAQWYDRGRHVLGAMQGRWADRGRGSRETQ